LINITFNSDFPFIHLICSFRAVLRHEMSSSSSELPKCLKCGSIKYKYSSKKYYNLNLSVKCGSHEILPDFFFPTASCFLCNACYQAAVRDYSIEPQAESSESSCQGNPLTILTFSLDPAVNQETKNLANQFPSLSKTVTHWKQFLSKQDFRAKLLAVLNKKDYFDDFRDVFPRSAAFKSA